MSESPTAEELKDLRDNALWERDHVGAPGCLTRTRAISLIKLLDAYANLTMEYKELEGEKSKLEGHLISMG
jgi:hypothetical protein